MSTLLLPLKFASWAGIGVALAVGWKLGSFLYDAATSQETRDCLFAACVSGAQEGDQPLWRRKYSRVSEE
jgi:hypothetical protein